MSLLSHWLRFPLCYPLRDILNLLSLVPAQLYPFPLRAYLCACIVFCMVLKPLGDLYLDLIVQPLVARFKTKYSNAKAWMTRFFFITSEGWKFPALEEVLRDFLVRTIWSPILDYKNL